jgi:hypothetical protein
MSELDRNSAPVSISTEARGHARDLRRRVEREDEAYLSTIHQLIEPVLQRLRRYPRRNLRPEMIAGLIERWRFMDSRDFRTHIEARLERTRASLTERRVVAGKMRLADPSWQGDDELDLGISEFAVLVDGNRFRVRSRVCCAFSLHALARRYQRHPDCDDAAVLHDMDLVARVDQAQLTPGGFKIVTDARHGGGWRGRVVRITDGDGEPVPVLSIRTWLDS